MAPARIASYRDLKVWQKGMDLVVASYRLTEQLPRTELYGLVSQIRRAAQVLAAHRLQFIDDSAAQTMLRMTAEIGRMLSGLSRRLRERSPSP